MSERMILHGPRWMKNVKWHRWMTFWHIVVSRKLDEIITHSFQASNIWKFEIVNVECVLEGWLTLTLTLWWDTRLEYPYTPRAYLHYFSDHGPPLSKFSHWLRNEQWSHFVIHKLAKIGIKTIMSKKNGGESDIEMLWSLTCWKFRQCLVVTHVLITRKIKEWCQRNMKMTLCFK